MVITTTEKDNMQVRTKFPDTALNKSRFLRAD